MSLRSPSPSLLLLGATLALGPLTASAAEAGRVSVEIDTSDVGEEAPVIERRIRERTDVVLRREGFLPARPGEDDPRLHVDVDALTGPDPGYTFELWIARPDGSEGERQRVECALCTESEIVSRIESAVVQQVSGMDRSDAAIAPKPAPIPSRTPAPARTMDAPPPEEEDGVAIASSPPDPQARPESRGPADRPRLGALGRTGLGLLGVGAAGVVAGAVMVALPARVDPEDPLYETATRPPGFAVLGAGVAVAVTGVILWAVDRRKRRTQVAARSRGLAVRRGNAFGR